MHDIRTLFAGLGDLRIELTMLGRFVLTVLDEETQLLQMTARTQDSIAVAAMGVNALLGKQATSTVFRAPGTDTRDEYYIAEWTALLAGRLEALR